MPEADFVNSRRWWEMAGDNIEEWGLQDPETLLLAAQEELGELTQAVLEHRHEGGDLNAAIQELDDLAPLMYQLHWVLSHELAE